MTTYAEPIRELIVRELVELFEAYTFESMTTPAVYRGRQIFDPETEPPPLVTILPRVEDSQRSEYGLSEQAMRVDVIALARMAGENPSELGEQILAELVLCVFGKAGTDADGDPEKLGGMSDTYADDVFYLSGGIDAYPDELGQQILHVGITVKIKYQTNIGDPFSN
jgi:hypothetical protein